MDMVTSQSLCPMEFFYCCQEDDAVMVRNSNPSHSMSGAVFCLICDFSPLSLSLTLLQYTFVPLFALCNKTLKR